MAVPVRAELEATLSSLSARLRGCMSRLHEKRTQALRAAGRALPSADQLLALPRRHFDETTARFSRALVVNTERKRARLNGVRLTTATLSRRIAETRRSLDRDMTRAQAGLRAILRERRAHFSRSASRIGAEPLIRRQTVLRDSLAALQQRGDRSIAVRLERFRGRSTQAERLLATLSHRSILERGFALVTDAEGGLIKRAAEVKPGAELLLRFADGEAQATATTGDAAAEKPKPQPRPSKPRQPGGQGSLF
jgi:exodeoxyribonuclease VII large subunit